PGVTEGRERAGLAAFAAGRIDADEWLPISRGCEVKSGGRQGFLFGGCRSQPWPNRQECFRGDRNKAGGPHVPVASIAVVDLADDFETEDRSAQNDERLHGEDEPIVAVADRARRLRKTVELARAGDDGLVVERVEFQVRPEVERFAGGGIDKGADVSALALVV